MTQDLIDWAVSTLEQGSDSPALRRLAALYGPEPLSESLPWFERSLGELGIELAPTNQRLSDYAALLAQMILAGQLEPAKGLSELAALNHAPESAEPLLRSFGDLQAAVELQADALGSYAWLYPAFDEQPLDDLIREECRLYLALRERRPPLGSLCMRCGQVVPPQPALPRPGLAGRIRRWLGRTPAPQIPACPTCGGQALLALAHPRARRRWLEQSS